MALKHRLSALFARLHRRVSRIEDGNAEISATLARIEAAVVEGNRTLLGAINTFGAEAALRAEQAKRHETQIIEHEVRLYSLEHDRKAANGSA